MILVIWVIWVASIMALNIIFMNFIIAVISESYSKVMRKLKSQLFKVKVELIAEREMLMSKEELMNPNYFPKYILLRRADN